LDDGYCNGKAVIMERRGIMRRFMLVVLVVSMVFVVFGCGKKSGLEGKVVDGKGEPVANVKIIAKQVQPIKGYEQFEATTNSDGTFSFGKLFPTSEYILFPWYEDWEEAPMRTLRYETNKLVARFNKEGWTTEQKMKVQSGPEGQTIMLASPMIIQPCISTITGKLVDGRKKPVKSIKIIAKQVKPVPGYEQFEATTNSDGTFSFKKLFPTSEYVLFPWYEDWTQAPMRTLRYETNKLVARFNKGGWTTEEKMKVQSGPEGQTTMLTSPMVIQPCISTVKGKVIDGKEKPLKGIKIIAKQVKPVPGYEQLEAITRSDGSFYFEKLFPYSKYLLIPNSGDWKTDVTWPIKTRGEQEQQAFKSPLTVRFTLANGVVTDSRTGLQWAARDNGKSIDWWNAKSYCENYTGGGYTDWRLPTLDELDGLYDSKSGNRYHVTTKFIDISKCCPWASETRGSEAAYFDFDDGRRDWSPQSGSIKFNAWSPQSNSYRRRALPVRSGK
jgi:hypothetical protein